MQPLMPLFNLALPTLVNSRDWKYLIYYILIGNFVCLVTKNCEQSHIVALCYTSTSAKSMGSSRDAGTLCARVLYTQKPYAFSVALFPLITHSLIIE